VEEDKMPTTVKSFMLGKSTLLAPPEVVPKYGLPPGAAASARSTSCPTTPRRWRARVRRGPRPPHRGDHHSATRTDGAVVVAAPPPTRGFVVFVDTTRIVIDLTAATASSSAAPSAAARQDSHRPPGDREMLGELDEEWPPGR
jgi:hypothetical protein